VNLDQAKERIGELETEVSRLKRELRDAKDKIYSKSRKINQMIQDNYDEVRLD